MNFWDTSALLPLVIHESTSELVLEIFGRSQPLCIWTLTVVEATAAICRLHRAGSLTAEKRDAAIAHLEKIIKSCVTVKNLELVKARAKRLLKIHPLKSADALQLAAALVSCQDQPQSHHFITFDKRLKESAGLEGFFSDLSPRLVSKSF